MIVLPSRRVSTEVQAGTIVELPWSGLATGGRYEWFARVTDCTTSVDGPRSEFTAQ